MAKGGGVASKGRARPLGAGPMWHPVAAVARRFMSISTLRNPCLEIDGKGRVFGGDTLLNRS